VSPEELLLAFDLGGTRLKAGLVSLSVGEPVAFETEDLPAGDWSAALKEIIRMGNKLARDAHCAGVALCVPGLVSDQGMVVSVPGKLEGIVGYDIAARLASEFGLRSLLYNDALAYGVGEAAFGAGKGLERVVVLTIGTGVGVAALDSGLPIGAGIYEGAILGGHIPISHATSGPVDSNGRPDTIEALCSARRILDYANQAGGRFRSVAEVYAAHARGDVAARGGLNFYRAHLCRALVALAHAHAPEAIVLGGGAMTAGNPAMPGLERQVNERTFGSYRVRVLTARLGDAAALAGLARLWEERSARE
jgi:glucokinase